MRERALAALALAVAAVAACNPNSAPPIPHGPTVVVELLGGPKSATNYSREITAREVNLVSGKVRSWSLGTDFAANPLELAPMSSQPPAAYLLGEYGLADLGIYTFLGTGPHRISGALAQRPDSMAPDQTVFGGDRQFLTRVGMDGLIVERWPIPIPLPGIYQGPSGKGGPTGHTPYNVNVAMDSAGDPFVLATNGVNAVLADMKRGRQTDIPGLGFGRGFGIRADGKAFALATSYVLAINPMPCPGCTFKEVDSLVEFDTRTLQLTGRYAIPAPRGELLLSSKTVDVILRSETSSTLLTLDEQHGTFLEHALPVAGWGLSATADWAGNVYLVSHPYASVQPASGARPQASQDRLMVYNQTTSRTSESRDPLRPPSGEEVLGLLFRG